MCYPVSCLALERTEIRLDLEGCRKAFLEHLLQPVGKSSYDQDGVSQVASRTKERKLVPYQREPAQAPYRSFT